MQNQVVVAVQLRNILQEVDDANEDKGVRNGISALTRWANRTIRDADAPKAAGMETR